MTFYIYDLSDSIYHELASLPGFSIDEVVNWIKKTYKSRANNIVPLTREEYKLLKKEIEKDPRSRDGSSEELNFEIFNRLKNRFIIGKYMSGEQQSDQSYSFWICGAFDTHSSVYAVGADTVGSYEFNLATIARKLGEKYFYNFATYKGKRVKDISSLLKLMKQNGYLGQDITKEQLIDLCNNNKYMIFRD